MPELGPRQCIATKSTSRSATVRAMFGSASPPETSLMISTSSSAVAAAVAAFMVSTETRMPRPTSSRTTGRMRRCSSPPPPGPPPGWAAPPPTSMMSAPAATSSTAWAIAASVRAKSPPSLKESGVTFSTPMMRGESAMSASWVVTCSRCTAHEGEHGGLLSTVGELPPARERHGGAADLPRAPRRDTVLARIEHDQHPPSVKGVGKGIRNLVGQSLLQLRTRSEGVDHPRQRAEPDDAATWQVRDVGEAHEGQQVVLAHRAERDVAHDHEFALAAVVEIDQVAEVHGGVDPHAGEELRVGLGDAAGRLGQSRGIRPDGREQLRDGGLDARSVNGCPGPNAPVRHPSAALVHGCLPYAVAMPGEVRGPRFGFGSGVESTPPSTTPASMGAFSGSGTGGRLSTGRLSLESHWGRGGSFLMSLKISAIWFWSSVSFSSSSVARRSRMSRLTVSSS